MIGHLTRQFTPERTHLALEIKIYWNEAGAEGGENDFSAIFFMIFIRNPDVQKISVL